MMDTTRVTTDFKTTRLPLLLKSANVRLCFGVRPVQGGATCCQHRTEYGMTPADSAKTEVTMQFPVENCYSKVIVSESLEFFWKYYYYYYIREYTYLTIYGKLPNLVVLTRSDLF